MISIRHFGYFNIPPYGIIDNILGKLEFNRPAIFFIIDPLTGEELPYDEMKLLDKDNLFVIVHTGEGHSHLEFDILLNQLLNIVGVVPSHITLYTGCLYDPQSPVNSIGTIVPHCGVTVSSITQHFINYPTTHHYVCLNRLPRWEREEIVTALLDRKIDMYGKISFASAFTKNEYRQKFKTDKRYRDNFPLYLDGVLKNINQSFQIEDQSITGALFNVVTESSYEIVDKLYMSDDSTQETITGQSLPVFSEKLYKSFLVGQIPILVSPYYTVNIAREFGFDMFDDIIDHGYDLEKDPVKRIQLVTDQVEKICNISVQDLVALKEKIMPRLIKNYNRVHHWAFNVDGDLPRWEKYFKQLGVLA